MITRRTILAGCGAAILGLLSHIRFAPSQPRRLRRRLAHIRIEGDGARLLVGEHWATLELFQHDEKRDRVDIWGYPLRETAPGVFELPTLDWVPDISAYASTRKTADGFEVKMARVTTAEREFTGRPPMIGWEDDRWLYCEKPAIQSIVPVYA